MNSKKTKSLFTHSDLHNNNITTLTPSSFGTFGVLNYFDLSGNPITTLTADSFVGTYGVNGEVLCGEYLGGNTSTCSSVYAPFTSFCTDFICSL